MESRQLRSLAGEKEYRYCKMPTKICPTRDAGMLVNRLMGEERPTCASQGLAESRVGLDQRPPEAPAADSVVMDL
jgi:hypothetical protein